MNKKLYLGWLMGTAGAFVLAWWINNLHELPPVAGFFTGLLIGAYLTVIGVFIASHWK